MAFYNIRKLVFIVAILAGLFALHRPASALLDQSQYSEEEKIGFAFHQLGGLNPDFQKWIKLNPKFKLVTPKERQNMLRHDYYRLEHGFHSYSPGEDLITITTKSRLTRNKNPKENETGYIKIEFLEGTGAYFTSQIADIVIAIVPEDIELFSSIPLKGDDYKDFVKKIGFTTNDATAAVELVLRPVAVDIEKPVVIDNKPLWPMLAEIGSISIWNQDMTTYAWSYEAPWYVPPERQDFIDLYRD